MTRFRTWAHQSQMIQSWKLGEVYLNIKTWANQQNNNHTNRELWEVSVALKF